MYFNFLQNRVIDQSYPSTQIYLQKNKNCINLQLAIRIFKKSRVSDMHYPIMDIQPDFEIIQITAKKNYLHRRTDGQAS